MFFFDFFIFLGSRLSNSWSQRPIDSFKACKETSSCPPLVLQALVLNLLLFLMNLGMFGIADIIRFHLVVGRITAAICTRSSSLRGRNGTRIWSFFKLNFPMRKKVKKKFRQRNKLKWLKWSRSFLLLRQQRSRLEGTRCPLSNQIFTPPPITFVIIQCIPDRPTTDSCCCASPITHQFYPLSIHIEDCLPCIRSKRVKFMIRNKKLGGDENKEKTIVKRWSKQPSIHKRTKNNYVEQ